MLSWISEENNHTEWDYGRKTQLGFIYCSPDYLEKLGGDKLFTVIADVLTNYLMWLWKYLYNNLYISDVEVVTHCWIENWLKNWSCVL